MDLTEAMVQLQRFLDSEGRLTVFPARKKYKLLSLFYLAAKFEPDIIYTEKEVNEIIELNHTFQDKWLLRRELINHGFLNRLADGSQYWKPKDQPKLEDII